MFFAVVSSHPHFHQCALLVFHHSLLPEGQIFMWTLGSQLWRRAANKIGLSHYCSTETATLGNALGLRSLALQKIHSALCGATWTARPIMKMTTMTTESSIQKSCCKNGSLIHTCRPWLTRMTCLILSFFSTKLGSTHEIVRKQCIRSPRYPSTNLFSWQPYKRMISKMSNLMTITASHRYLCLWWFLLHRIRHLAHLWPVRRHWAFSKSSWYNRLRIVECFLPSYGFDDSPSSISVTVVLSVTKLVASSHHMAGDNQKQVLWDGGLVSFVQGYHHVYVLRSLPEWTKLALIWVPDQLWVTQISRQDAKLCSKRKYIRQPAEKLYTYLLQAWH